jgi:hypothetical protein
MVSRSPAEKVRKRSFSGFTLADAYKQLQLSRLQPWELDVEPVAPGAFFQERLLRLRKFDLRQCEESKKLLIDALLEEALQRFEHLKMWKGASLDSEFAGGYVDYLLSDNRDYLEAPFLCIVEAKKDDFEQGLAQCLVEMQACQWSNQQIERSLDVFGIVTNGEGWKFYKLSLAGTVYEIPVLYSTQNIPAILGVLNFIFEQCTHTLLSGTGD